MPETSNRKAARVKRFQKTGLIVVGLFLLYVMLGFWAVPPLLKPRLEEKLSGLLGRRVTLSEIKLNPLVLSATASELTIHEKDGQLFAGFEALYANAQLSSIIKSAFTLREIRVSAPFGVLKLLPDNQLNVDDILANLSTPESASTGEKEALPRVVIERFEIIEGRIVLENLTAKEPIREELAPISFSFENLSTLQGREGGYQIVGSGSGGDNFEINGRLTVNPVRASGRVVVTGSRIPHYWEHLKDLVSFQIVNGTIGLSGDYTVEIVDGRPHAMLENGVIRLENFELVEKGEKAVMIAIPIFSAHGVGADLGSREVDVERIEMADGRVRSWLSPEGTFALQQLFQPNREKPAPKKQAQASDVEPAPGRPWKVALGRMEVRNWEMAFEDRTLAEPAKLSADNIEMVLENVTNQKGETAALDVAMRINKAGQVMVKGTGGIVPLQAALDVVVNEIALEPFQPYVDDAFSARIASGSTSSKGRIDYRGPNARHQIRYEGDLSIDDVEIRDSLQTEDIITLVQFKASGLGINLRPNELNVSQALIDRPHARVTIDEAGVVNVIKAFASGEEENTAKKKSVNDGQENLLKRLVNFLILQFKGPMPMRIDRVRLKTFTGDFVDASITPTYTTRLEIADATVTGLSSDPSAQADFKFHGSIDGNAVLEGSGQVNPMNTLQYSQVDASLKNFALAPVSPYAARFIGFRIDQGTLGTELEYRVAENVVEGDHLIIIDRLELGEKVDSPDALNLPVKLGVTLLKDSKGRIEVEVPVKGDVKDPQFDFQKTILRALTGTIEKVGSAPFAAIAKIDGFSGEALSTVAFEFGSSELQYREVQKLKALASVLKSRSALRLGIAASADRQMDGAAILGQRSGSTPSVEGPVAEQAAPAFDTGLLEQLAQRRADNVRGYLVEQAGIDAERIQVESIQIKATSNGENNRVAFSLSVG